MSSTVCQGLQPCLEPKLTKPTIIIQNLASPQVSTVLPSSINPWPQIPNVSPPQHDNDDNNGHHSYLDSKHHKTIKNDSFWSSITSQNSKPVHSESDKLYVHPLAKRSSSMLSIKSLEMCTESLGSETGSNIGESIDDLPSGPLLERFVSMGRRTGGDWQKKIHRSASYPPPLTSISGSEGVQMRPHREGGRLVLKAFSVTPCSPYFKTERSNGRLRLSLLKEEEEEEEDDGDFNTDVMHGQDIQVEDQLAIADEEEESTAYNDDDDDANGLEVNDENDTGYEVGGVGEFPRPISSRCKEGEGNRNKGIPSWEPFWVAIS